LAVLLGFGLLDLKPANEKGYTGTFYNWKKKRHERIDYLLASAGLHRELKSARLRDDKTAKIASDHYSLSAEFEAEDR
jgi:endonuclease/exonuclease/phosphatase family metal-dependent hydrolase